MQNDYKLQLWPADILARECKPVTVFGKAIWNLAEHMYRIMLASKGIGIAANQVGSEERVIVTGCHGQRITLVNPEITWTHPGLIETQEGCLSFPGEFLTTCRALQVKVRFQDPFGNTDEITADGQLGVVIQHEIDHLNGLTFRRFAVNSLHGG